MNFRDPVYGEPVIIGNVTISGLLIALFLALRSYGFEVTFEMQSFIILAANTVGALIIRRQTRPVRYSAPATPTK